MMSAAAMSSNSSSSAVAVARRSSAARSRYSAICVANTAGSHPSVAASLPRDLRKRVSRPVFFLARRGAVPSTGMTSVCTCVPAASSSRSQSASAAASFSDSSSEVRTKSGTRSPSEATACSVVSEATSSAWSGVRASVAIFDAWRRSGSMARISGMSGSEHEQHEDEGGEREDDKRRVLDALISHRLNGDQQQIL